MILGVFDVRLVNFLVALIFISLANTIFATEVKHSALFTEPTANRLYVASTGEVVVTFISKSAAYSSDLYLAGSPTKILNNQTATPGQNFLLGSFQAGTELVFRMYVNNTGHSFYNGEAASNPDNTVHATYKTLGKNAMKVGFEDIYNGGDRDYNDLVFSVNNVTIRPPVPEPDVSALMLVGLLMLGVVAHKKAK
jgi:hypothetical protein